MRESDPATKSTFDLLLGERTVGRPKSRRVEEVERELRGMGVKGWTRINGRKFWRRPRPKLGCRAKEREREGGVFNVASRTHRATVSGDALVPQSTLHLL
jgi:hypothetical protein